MFQEVYQGGRVRGQSLETSGFGEAWATDLISSVTLLQAVTQAQRQALRSLVNEQLQVIRDTEQVQAQQAETGRETGQTT